MNKDHLTTGQVAEFLSVTPDTVLKWIKAGKIPAIRTVGGHYRIAKDDVESLASQRSGTKQHHYTKGSAHFCWEHYSRSGEITDDCKECLVYKTKAKRCYEMSHLTKDLGHQKLYCTEDCEDCEYYQLVHEQPVNILVISNDEALLEKSSQEGEKSPFKIQVTSCGYESAVIVDVFKPDYAVIDCGLGLDRAMEIGRLLLEDARIPFIRVLLASETDDFPEKCDKEIFATIKKPFTLEQLRECIESVSD